MANIKAIFFDLFWTLIEVQADAQKHASAPLLFSEVRRQGAHIPESLFYETFARQREAVFKSWEAGVEEETLSRDKMRHFLQSLRLKDHGFSGKLEALADDLVGIHMAYILRTTCLPLGHHALLKNVSQKFPLALVSNFDDGQAARDILQHHDIDHFFKSVVISADLGKRKPHALLFETAIDALAVNPEEVLMIGDSPLCDVEGARRCGIQTAWVRRAGAQWPKHLESPNFVFNHLDELVKIVA